MGSPPFHKELQIGGQAVIEGVVMRGPEKWALAVRRPSGDIYIEENPTLTLAQRYTNLNKFPLRGIFALVDSLVIGVKSLSISGAIALEEETEGEEAAGPVETGEKAAGDGSGEERGAGKRSGDGQEALSTVQVTFTLIIALVLFLGIFIAVPAVIAKSLDTFLQSTVLYNLVEGTLRVGIFVAYLAVIGFVPDVKRMFAYHGAEHKVVHAYEHGLPLTEASAEEFSTAHMRCGTTFVLIVFVISILVFSFMGRPALWLRIVERVAFIPLVVAISYEIIRVAGRHEDSRVVRIVMYPGLLLQRLTTREPDAEQLQVAIESLEAAVGHPAVPLPVAE